MVHRHLQKIRGKSLITKEELIADLVFFSIAAILSFIIVSLFDIHHSFYSWPIFPLKFIFTTPEPYIYGILIGTIIGFFLIKLFLFGVKEEEVAKKKRK